MSDGEPGGAVQGLLFTHGAMADGMVDAVRRISGAGEDALVALTNEGLGPDALCGEVERLTRGRPTIVFTDLQAGSCAMAARLGIKERRDCAVICGTNLPMLLDFVFHRDLPVRELVARLEEKGRQGIRVLQEPCGTP